MDTVVILPEADDQTPNLHNVVCLDFSGSMKQAIDRVKDQIYKYFKFKNAFKLTFSLILFSDYEPRVELHRYFRFYPNLTLLEFESILFRTQVWGGGSTNDELAHWALKFAQYMHNKMYPRGNVKLNINLITDEGIRLCGRPYDSQYQAVAERRLLQTLVVGDGDIPPINAVTANADTFITILGLRGHLKPIYSKWETLNFKFKHISDPSELVGTMMCVLYSVFVRLPLSPSEQALYDNPLIIDEAGVTEILAKINAPGFRTPPTYYGNANDTRRNIIECLDGEDDTFKVSLLEVLVKDNHLHLPVPLLRDCFRIFKHHPQTRTELEYLLNRDEPNSLIRHLQQTLYSQKCSPQFLCDVCYTSLHAPTLGVFVYLEHAEGLSAPNLALQTLDDIKKLRAIVANLRLTHTKPLGPRYRVIDGTNSTFACIPNIVDQGDHKTTLVPTSPSAQILKHFLINRFGERALPGVAEVDYDELFMAGGQLRPTVFSHVYTTLADDDNIPKVYRDILQNIRRGLGVRMYDHLTELKAVNETPTYFQPTNTDSYLYCNHCQRSHPPTFFYNVKHVEPFTHPDHISVARFVAYHLKLTVGDELDTTQPLVCVNEIYRKEVATKVTPCYFSCVQCACWYYVESNTHSLTHNRLKPKCPSCANDIKCKVTYNCPTHKDCWHGFSSYYSPVCSLCPAKVKGYPVAHFKITQAQYIDTLTDPELATCLMQAYCPELQNLPANTNYRNLWTNSVPSLYTVFECMGLVQLFEHWVLINKSVAFSASTLNIRERVCVICCDPIVIVSELCTQCKRLTLCSDCFYGYVRDKVTKLSQGVDQDLTLKCINCIQPLDNWIPKIQYIRAHKVDKRELFRELSTELLRSLATISLEQV